MRLAIPTACFALLLGAFSALGAEPGSAMGPERNGFVLVPATVPAQEIMVGAPRDRIPALDAPALVAAADAPWHDDDLIIGVVRGDAARAYPIALLNWHELVNDELGGEPILVSFCPLCGTALVFDRHVDGAVHRFGVSGLLYKSDLLLYDHETKSLWSQIEARAVTGPALGKRLRVLRSAQLPWSTWKSRHPQTTVLSLATGHRRDYRRYPYGDYATSESLFFPAPRDPRYHAKMPTLGVRIADGPARAYPALEIASAGGRVAEDFEGRRIEISYDPDTQVFEVNAPDDVEVIEGFWFAWAAFHPESTVFVAKPARPEPAGGGVP